MKILYVDLQYHYGKKENGPNYIGTFGFNKSFFELGHEVDSFYYDPYMNNNKSLQKELIKYADKVSPDLIFFILIENQFTFETLKLLKNKYVTANWFGDDSWRFEEFTSNYAKYFTYSITTDPYSIHKYHDIGIKNVILSQWAAIKNETPFETTPYEYDTTFVGGAHPVRKWIVYELKKKGIHIETFGFGWPNGPVSLEKMEEIFRKSKINLNLANSNTFDARYFIRNPRNIITSIRSPKVGSQIKARNFEIPYNGGFQLTDYVPGLERYFDLGEEIACYKGIDDMALQINYFLRNEIKREEIKNNGYSKAKNTHTYYHRIKEFLTKIQKTET